ncbi:MAG: DUF2306 domain-containing protein [Bacillaceae bacterium]|nr:DUF2306 domain-containing protein [Bacillaceae bacterium]
MHIFEISRYLHIVSGFIALLIFWIPVVTRKGGKIHNRAGWLYVIAMYLVALSALYMAIWRIFFNPGVDQTFRAFSIFLIFIAILSASTAWYGIRVLRFKNRKHRHTHPVDLGFSLALLLSGIMVSIYGFIISFPLLAYFPIVGIFLGVSQLKYWISVPYKKVHWIYEHLASMLGCSIATITAFTVFGAPRLLGVSTVHMLVWFLPTILLTPVIIGFSIYYRRKFEHK